MLRQTETARGNLSFFLGGKGPTECNDWKPNIDAVRAAITYVLSTGRLEPGTGAERT